MRLTLGKSTQELKEWLGFIPQLKLYARQFEEAGVTGEAMLAVESEQELAERFGILMMTTTMRKLNE